VQVVVYYMLVLSIMFAVAVFCYTMDWAFLLHRYIAAMSC